MKQPRMSAEECLAWDVLQHVKQELVRGELFPKEGADERHNITAGNVAMALRAHLRGQAVPGTGPTVQGSSEARPACA